MISSLRSGALPVVLAAFASLLLGACGSMGVRPPRILADGARWEEVSRAGRLTSEGVVAAKDGMIYVVDFTPMEVLKQNNPGGTIYRYDPNTGATTKFMEPDGLALGLHVDRNGDLLIAQGAEPGGGRAIVRRNLATGATSVVADSYQGKRLVSPNDVTSDAQGRIYFTDARYFGHEPIVERLNAEFVKAMRDPRFQEKFLKAQAFDAVGNSPEEFAEFLKADRANAKQVVKMTGIHLEHAKEEARK